MATQRSPEEYKRAYEHHKSQGNAEAAARVANLYRQYQSTQPKAKDGAFEGYGDAFMRGIDQPLENMGVTAEALGAKGLGESLKGAVDERPGQSASGQFMNADKDGTFAYRYLPKAAVEQAGQFAGSLLARAGGAAVGGAVGNVPGAIAGGLAGPMMFEFAQQLGPIALERAKNNGRETPNKEDWTYATGTSAGVGALNAIAPGATGKIKRMLIEGVTEGTQSVGEQVGSTVNTQKGLEVDPRQAVAEGLIGGTSAGMVDTSISTAKAAANLVRGTNRNSKAKSEDVSEEEMQAKASFAQTLASIAEEEKLDLTNIDRTSTKGARQAVDLAHKRLVGDLKARFKDLKPLLAVTDQDSLSQLEDKIFANLAQDEARTKVKNKVGSKEKQAFVKLAGNTYEGAKALNVMLQLDELTEIHSEGYKGGVSRVTDQLAPLGLGGEGYDVSRANAEQIFRPLLSTAAAAQTGGLSLIPQAAIFGGGRLIDKARGGRSRVQAYVNANQGNPGQTLPSESTSLRNQNIAAQEAVAAQEEEARLRQEQYTEEERQANLRRVQQGAPPQQGSPEDIMRDATGLDRSGLAQVIRILKANPNTLPATTRAIEAYETSVATGGQVDFGLYRDINALVDQYPQLQNLMVRPRNAQSAAQGQAQQQLSQKEQNYQRGIENNRAEAARITEAVNADSTIPVQQKAMLLNTLEEMQLDLGLNPVSRLQAMARRLEEKGVPGPTVEKYLGQYLQRVMAQQGAKEERDAAQDDAMEIDESREMSFTGGPALAFDTSPNVISLMEGSEKPPVMKGKKQVAKYLEQRALDRMGGKPRDIKNKQDQMAIAEDMAREAVYEMESSDNPNFEWYDTVIDKTIEMMSVKHPELLSDPQAKTALLVSIAITSQNLAVPENLKYGEEVYSHYAKTGKFLEKKYGSKGGAVLKNLEKANTLLNKLGSMEKMREFLETKFTVRELNPILQEVLGVAKVSGELIDTEVYGSQLFGPKIGNGFYTNLRGDFSPVTIDMWFMRTIGRLRGKLMEFDPAKFAEHSDRLKAAIGRKRISKEALIAEARKIKSQHEKDYKKYRDDYDDGTREKSEAVLAAETMIKGLDGTIDTPGAGKDKKALRDITRMAVARFNELTGLDIPPASFQALIWYPEQDLYSKLGVQLKSLRADYASSTKKILMEEGFNEKDLDTAANRVRQRTQLGTGQVRPSSTENVQEENGQSNLPVSGAIREENQEVDLSTVPGSGALTQPESPQIPFDFTTPTVGQIKDKLEDAKDAVQMVIGKPGTKFEKGLSSYEDYKQLADLLDVSIGVYDSQKDFMRDFPVGEATLGVFGVAKGGVSGQVGLIKGNKEQDFIQTLAHEVSHALESRPQSNQESPLVQGRKLSQRHEQAAADKKSSVYLGSLRSKMRKEIFNETPVKDEIEVLQDGTVVSIAARPDLPGRPIRLNVDNSIETYSAANPDATVAQIFSDVVPQFRQYQSYIKGDAEFAVDPVMYYLINPKAMKKDMPNTFKFIQKHFNESNIPIKLYASPLATIVAILMAGMIGGEEEEENPGILTPGPGMLSA